MYFYFSYLLLSYLTNLRKHTFRKMFFFFFNFPFFFILKTPCAFPVRAAQCVALHRRRRRRCCCCCCLEEPAGSGAAGRAPLSSRQRSFTAQCPAARSQVSRGDRVLGKSRGAGRKTPAVPLIVPLLLADSPHCFSQPSLPPLS